MARTVGAGRRRAAQRVHPSANPGLRREELAQLAGLSVDYVVRLEQGRGPRPSMSVLTALSSALRLSGAETEHLSTPAGSALPGTALPSTDGISDVVRPSVLRLLERMGDLPAVVVNARGDILAWNALATAVLGDLSRVPAVRRTHLWLQFVADETFTSRLVGEGPEGLRLDRATVARARAAAARYPLDARLRSTVAELRERVPRFAQLWDQRPLEHRHSDVKSHDVPGVGRITFDCESLMVPDDDLTMVVYSAAPGSPDAHELELIKAMALHR